MKRSLTAAEFRALNSGKRNSRKNLLAKAEKQFRKQDKRIGKPDAREKSFDEELTTEGEKRMEEYYRERKR